MTDRELLEFAARAAGIEVIGWTLDKNGVEALATQDGYFQPLLVNTLTDCMGDALRLAVRLGLSLHCGREQAEAKDYDDTFVCIEEQNNDPYAATRRAIVRAAAEIGKELK